MVGLLVSCGIVNIILRLLQDCCVDYLRLAWNSFWIRVLAIGAHVHIVIIVCSPLFLERWPSFLAYQRIIILVFGILFEEGLGSGGLALVVMGAHVSADVFGLVKVAVVNIFLHAGLAHVRAWAHDDAGARCLVGAVENISVCYVLGMYGTTTFDHRQLLGVEVLI